MMNELPVAPRSNHSGSVEIFLYNPNPNPSPNPNPKNGTLHGCAEGIAGLLWKSLRGTPAEPLWSFGAILPSLVILQNDMPWDD